MEAQSQVINQGLTMPGSTFLGTISSDFGGSNAKKIAQRSAEDYLARYQPDPDPSYGRFGIRARVAGASVISVAILAVDHNWQTLYELFK